MVARYASIEVALQSHPQMTSGRIQMALRIDCAPGYLSQSLTLTPTAMFQESLTKYRRYFEWDNVGFV